MQHRLVVIDVSGQPISPVYEVWEVPVFLCHLKHAVLSFPLKKIGIHFKTIILVYIIIFLENYKSEVV